MAEARRQQQSVSVVLHHERADKDSCASDSYNDDPVAIRAYFSILITAHSGSQNRCDTSSSDAIGLPHTPIADRPREFIQYGLRGNAALRHLESVVRSIDNM